jgi:hypothetical protein
VNLHVKGATTWVFWLEENWNLKSPVFIGEMDYYFSATMIVYEGNLGDPVPNLWIISFPDFFGMDPIGECTKSHMTVSGTGTFTAYAEELGLGISGDSVNVKMNQVGLTKPEGHPFYPALWPVENIFFH